MKKVLVLAVILAALFQISGCNGRLTANTVRSSEDLAGKNIGVVKGSAATVCADGYGTLHIYESAEAMLVDLKNAVLDCAVMDESLAKSLVKKVRGLKILSQPLFEAEFRFAIAKENPDLLEAVNTALKDLKSNGTLEKIVQSYIPGNDYRYKTPDDADLSLGALTLAVDAALPPYSYRDGKDKPAGLHIDVARAICDSLHVKMEVSVVSTSDLVIAVQYGKADLSLPGIMQSEGDDELVVFSEPYTTCTQVIVTRR